MNIDEHVITDPARAKEYIFAGKAHFTIRSVKTGTRFTYRLNKKEDQYGRCVWFLGVMTGTDNDYYDYVGLVTCPADGPPVFRLTAKSKFKNSDFQVQASEFFFNHLNAGKVHPGLELWHDGRCGRCHRHLTTPESVERGIGPECWGIMMGRAA